MHAHLARGTSEAVNTATAPSWPSLLALVCLCWFGIAGGLFADTEKVISGTDSSVVLLSNTHPSQVMSPKLERVEVVNAGSDLVIPRGSTVTHPWPSTEVPVAAESMQIDVSHQNLRSRGTNEPNKSLECHDWTIERRPGYSSTGTSTSARGVKILFPQPMMRIGGNKVGNDLSYQQTGFMKRSPTIRAGMS